MSCFSSVPDGGWVELIIYMAKPFIVQTGKLVTTMLDTAFNIKEIKPAEAVRDTVNRDKISVANCTRLFGNVSPDRKLIFEQLGQESVKKSSMRMW